MLDTTGVRAADRLIRRTGVGVEGAEQRVWGLSTDSVRAEVGHAATAGTSFGDRAIVWCDAAGLIPALVRGLAGAGDRGVAEIPSGCPGTIRTGNHVFWIGRRRRAVVDGVGAGAIEALDGEVRRTGSRLRTVRDLLGALDTGGGLRAGDLTFGT